VTDYLYSDRTSVLASIGVGVVLLGFWFVAPIARRIRHHP
jgi:hypothetical protein